MLNENLNNVNNVSGNPPPNNNIKFQSIPDLCLETINTPQDIYTKIEQIKRDTILQASSSASSSSNTLSLLKDKDIDLYERKWIPITTTTSSENINDDNDNDDDDLYSITTTFQFLQFNILAQGLSVGPDILTPFEPKYTLSSQDYFGGFTDIPYVDIVLDYDLRRWRIIEVLISEEEEEYDIIAIEEIDRYKGFFEPLLSILGYEGYFVPKPKSPCVTFGWYSDGCAIFYKSSKFKLVRHIDKKYNVGNQIYTIATLQHLETNQEIVVAVTHLKAGKASDNEIIRNSQIQELLNTIQEEIIVEVGKKDKNDNDDVTSSTTSTTPPIILAGDFNSDPRETNSCIQRILSKSSRKEKTKSSSLSLKSAYQIPGENDDDDDDEGGDDGNPKKKKKDNSLLSAITTTYTTWKKRGDTTNKRIIDFIFHNGGRDGGDDDRDDDDDRMVDFHCSHVLGIPKDEEVLANGLLPGLKYPSDHIAIGAKFKISIKKKKKIEDEHAQAQQVDDKKKR